MQQTLTEATRPLRVISFRPAQLYGKLDYRGGAWGVCAHMMTRRAVHVVLAAALVGCGSSPPPPPPPGIIDLTIEAAPDVNPDPSGRPSPVVVRVYQLASDAKFKAVDFFQLFDRESATLAADLVFREELMVVPGQATKLSTPLKQGGQSVGVVAAFRDIDRAQWRATVEVPPNGTTPLGAKLSGTAVSLAKSGS
jgi:type VI secretion system protein VasD